MVIAETKDAATARGRLRGTNKSNCQPFPKLSASGWKTYASFAKNIVMNSVGFFLAAFMRRRGQKRGLSRSRGQGERGRGERRVP